MSTDSIDPTERLVLRPCAACARRVLHTETLPSRDGGVAPSARTFTPASHLCPVAAPPILAGIALAIAFGLGEGVGQAQGGRPSSWGLFLALLGGLLLLAWLVLSSWLRRQWQPEPPPPRP